jgi:hypothetical protein
LEENCTPLCTKNHQLSHYHAHARLAECQYLPNLHLMLQI